MTMKRIKIVHEEDRISWLPDCLLIEILFRLDSTKDAVKASSLSKRWRHLWTQVPNLAFHQSGRSLDELSCYIEKTLSQCERQSYLARFKLELNSYDDIKLELKLNRWIRYVLNRNVQEIDLRLYNILEAPFVLDKLIFTNSCFTHLKFKGCRLNPTGAISWINLKSLSFSYAKLDEGVIQNILSGSPLLETFKLVFCYGFRRLDITSKSVKNLVFSGYLNRESYMSRHVIKINAPYISSLTIQDILAIKKLLLINLTSLFEANLDFWMRWVMNSEVEEMLKCVFLNLQHVKEIKIGNSCQKALSGLKAKGFTCPTNVKYVHRLDYH